MTWDAATPLMLAKLHREMVRRVDQGVRRCARKGDLDLLGSKESCSSCLERWASSRPLWDAVLQRSCSPWQMNLVRADALLMIPRSSCR
jgi:hypothetical protein